MKKHTSLMICRIFLAFRIFFALRIFSIFKIFFALLLFNIANAKNYGGNYYWRMIGGGPLQMLSFRIGSNFTRPLDAINSSVDLNSTGLNNVGYSIGWSVGWNYFSAFYKLLDDVEDNFDIGFHIKYNFNNDSFKSNLIGAEVYFHFPCATSDFFINFPQPLSLILGSGAIFINSKNNANLSQNINGYYFEVGVGVAKYFIINMNMLYRFSFFPPDSIKANLRPIEQSVHVELVVL